MKSLILNFYTKRNCPLCEKGKAVLEELSSEFMFTIHEHDIYQNDQLLELYQVMIPVIELEGEVIVFGIIEKNSLRKRLQSKMG